MRLNIIRFKVVSNKRKHRKENMPIGSAIKFKRRELHMTLEEASKDICSVSYLSKLENNVIVPSDKYVIQLKQRFCIREEASLFDETLYESLKHKLITSMLNERKLNDSYLNQIGTQLNYQTLLLKFGLYVLAHDQQKIQLTYQQILSLIPSMPDEEFAIVVCLMSKMLHEETRYQESNEVLAMMPYESVHDELVLFRDKWVLINALKMDNSALFHLLYPKYQETLVRLGYYKQINELKHHTLTYFSHVMSVDAYVALLHQNQSVSKKFYPLAKAMNLLSNGEYKSVLKYIDKPSFMQNDQAVIIKLLALDGLNQSDKIMYIIKQIDNTSSSYNQRLIIQFLKVKHQQNKQTLLTYLRTVILGDGFLTDDVMILKYFQHQAHTLFRKYFYYKEATEVYIKFNQKIEMLKKSAYIGIEEPAGSFFYHFESVCTLLFHNKYCILI